MRILIYSQDGFGLGHLRRNLNIIHQVKKKNPQASILIIVDSPVAPFFELPPGCDFIKIPTVVKVDYGVWQSKHLPMDSRKLLQVRSEIIKNVALNFQPDYFLVDHMPQGALGELATPLQMMKQYSPRTRAILGLRDILGAPEDIIPQWQQEEAYQLAETYYDKILIYGSSEVFNSLQAYQFSENVVRKTHYCGYVCREEVPEEFINSELEHLLPEDGERFVLVTGGGGHDAAFFMEKFIEAAQLLNGQLNFKAIISTGPFLRSQQIQRLQQKARNAPVTVISLGEDVIHFLLRADLVVSMAGYNTISEILCFRKNAIIVPRRGPSAEQKMRTRIFAGRGLFDAIFPEELTAEKLAEHVFERLQKPPNMQVENIPELNGAANAASILLENV